MESNAEAQATLPPRLAMDIRAVANEIKRSLA
jgi:hypothetical protein